MKLLSSPKKARGNVLLVTIVMAGVAAVAICGYLSLIATQNNLTVRSQVWNLCMPVVEAGLEEAMSHINDPNTVNFATDGWTWTGSNSAFTLQRTIGDGYYVATIQTNLTNGPIITSTGYIPAPVTINNDQSPFLASAVPAPGVSYISRKVQLTTFKQPLLAKAMVVRNSVNFNGNNVTVDSYDSSKGAYNANSNRGDKGDICTDMDIVGNVTTGNGDVWGHVTVGPHASVSTGPNSVIGSLGWHSGGNKGAQTGWLRKDSNLLVPDVKQPWTQGSFLPPPPQGSYKYELDGGNFEVAGNFTLGSSDKMYVKADSTLWVRGDLNLTGSGNLMMTSGGHLLTVYVSGNITIGGDVTQSSDPGDLVLYGLPTCKTVSAAGAEAVIYAPQADMTMIGNANFFGAAVVNSIRMNGSTGFHYDENLAKYGAFRGYVITSWKEI